MRLHQEEGENTRLDPVSYRPLDTGDYLKVVNDYDNLLNLKKGLLGFPRLFPKGLLSARPTSLKALYRLDAGSSFLLGSNMHTLINSRSVDGLASQ